MCQSLSRELIIPHWEWQLAEGRSVGYTQSTAKKLNLWQLSRVEGLNLGQPDYKTSTLTTQPHCLFIIAVRNEVYYLCSMSELGTQCSCNSCVNISWIKYNEWCISPQLQRDPLDWIDTLGHEQLFNEKYHIYLIACDGNTSKLILIA